MYTDDGVFEAHPGCVRAVRETAELLKKDGHDVVEVRNSRGGAKTGGCHHSYDAA